MKKTVIALLVVILLIAFVPLFALKDAEFGGSDDAGSQVVEEVDSSFQPIAEPILEKILGRELPAKWKVFCSVYRLPSEWASWPSLWEDL